MSHNVKAGVGASYEEDTLDLYENEYVWELRETNAEVWCLSFAKSRECHSDKKEVKSCYVIFFY